MLCRLVLHTIPGKPQHRARYKDGLLANLDQDSGLEVIATDLNGLYVWDDDGDEFLNGDNDPSTNTAFVQPTLLEQSVGFVGTPAVADIDDDGTQEIVFTRWEDSLYVYEATGEIEWVRGLTQDHIFTTDGSAWSSPSIGNIKGNSDSLEIVVGSYAGVLYAFDAAGNGVVGPCSGCAEGVFDTVGTAYLYQTAALADIDTSTSQLEVVIGTGTYAGAAGNQNGRIIAYSAVDTAGGSDGYADKLWTYQSDFARAVSTTVVGPLTSDGSTKIVATLPYDGVTSGNDWIVVLDGSGSLCRQFGDVELSANSGNPIPPTLADIDRDGVPEIVVGGRYDPGTTPTYGDSLSIMYVYDYEDARLDTVYGYVPKSVFSQNSVTDGAIVADIDGDGNVEAVMGTDSFGLFAWQDSTGNSYSVDLGWPIMLNGEINSPAVGDVDADGDMELVVNDRSGRVHMFDLPADADSVIEWTQFGGNAQHTFFYEDASSEDFRLAEAPARRVVTRGLGNAFPNPFNPMTRMTFGVDRPSATKLRIYDVTGRLVRVLVDDYLSPGEHVATWDGRNDRGESVASGVYIASFAAGNITQSRKLLVLR
jgi:hypothetical protein